MDTFNGHTGLRVYTLSLLHDKIMKQATTKYLKWFSSIFIADKRNNDSEKAGSSIQNIYTELPFPNQ